MRWSAFDRKLVGKGIARDARSSFRGSVVADLGNAEPGNLMDQSNYLPGTAVNLDATSEGDGRDGILAALRPFLTC